MANDKNWTIRRTAEREVLVEKLRAQLKISGRKVETMYDTVTTSAIFDEALKELEKALERDSRSKT